VKLAVSALVAAAVVVTSLARSASAASSSPCSATSAKILSGQTSILPGRLRLRRPRVEIKVEEVRGVPSRCRYFLVARGTPTFFLLLSLSAYALKDPSAVELFGLVALGPGGQRAVAVQDSMGASTYFGILIGLGTRAFHPIRYRGSLLSWVAGVAGAERDITDCTHRWSGVVVQTHVDPATHGYAISRTITRVRGTTARLVRSRRYTATSLNAPGLSGRSPFFPSCTLAMATR
jgi:hypothetical protein